VADPKKLSAWNQLADALGLKANDLLPFLQVEPESVDPITGGPGGNDLTIEAGTLGAALARIAGYLLAANNLADLDDIAAARDNLGLGTLATWTPLPPEDADAEHFLRGDKTWQPAGGLGAGLLFELPGAVIPVATTSAPHIPVLANGTLKDVMVSLNVPPDTGMQLVIDVFVTGVSLFPGTKPTLAAGVTLGHFVIPTPTPIVAFSDLVTAAVITPAGRDLTIVVG
jgi:hypothetical protein